VAVGQFESWDTIEPAPGSVLAKLNLQACGDLVEETRASLSRLFSSGEMAAPAVPESPSSRTTSDRCIGYVSLSSRRGDFLHDILMSMGLAVERLEPECLATDRKTVVNCIDVPAKRLAPFLGSGLFADSRLVVTDRHHFDEHRSLGTAVKVPISYAALRAACEAVTRSKSATTVGAAAVECAVAAVGA
jgi:hypothetical protein